MRIIPTRLKKGDTIGIIAPSSPPNLANLQRSFQFLGDLGLKFKLGKSIDKVKGYLAGTDEERLNDVHAMFKDPEIAGIICAGGGYGAARYTDRLDFDLIAKNPKIFWGYSDITFLHTAIGQYSNLVTFHGPMLASDVGKSSFAQVSGEMFQQLFEPEELVYNEEISPLETIASGIGKGELVGGNLSLLTKGIGTKFEIDTQGKLLLIEDIGEKPYRIDGMLNQLRQANKLRGAAGIIVGDFAYAEPPKKEASLTLEEVLQHYLTDLGVPVVKGFKIGHCQPHFAVPLGVKGILDGALKELRISSGVK